MIKRAWEPPRTIKVLAAMPTDAQKLVALGLYRHVQAAAFSLRRCRDLGYATGERIGLRTVYTRRPAGDRLVRVAAEEA